MSSSRADEWRSARKKPVEVEFRGPYTDTDTIETIEGDFEVDDEYIDEHGGYVIIRGVDGEVYPCGLDIFRRTYEQVAGEESDRDDEWWDWRVHRASELYREASMTWGHEPQWAKAAEEFAELAAICARDLNDQADQQALLEELVDARIMMEQITRHITDDSLDEMVESKLEQLDARLRRGGGDDAE